MKRVKIEDENIAYAVNKIASAYRILELGGFREATIVGWLLGYIKEKYANRRNCVLCGQPLKKEQNGENRLICEKCAKSNASSGEIRPGGSDSVRIERGTVVGQLGVADYIDYLDRFKNASEEDKLTAFRLMSAVGESEEVKLVGGPDKIRVTPCGKDDFDVEAEKRASKSIENDPAHILWKMQQEKRMQLEKASLRSMSGLHSNDENVTNARASDTYEEARLFHSFSERICINCKFRYKAESLQDGVLCKKDCRKHDFDSSCLQFEYDERINILDS